MSEQDRQDPGETPRPERRNLWFTPDRARFFLVPHDLTLPPGDLVVRSLSALRSSLSAESLEPYEVSIDVARAHVDAGWEDVAGSVRELWETVLSAVGRKDDPAESARVPRLDWLGATPGEAATDPEKARTLRKTLVERTAQLLGAELDEEKLSRYEAALDRLGTAVVRDAERMRSGVSELAEGITEGVDKLEAKRPELEATIEATGDALFEFGRDALSRLQQLSRSARKTPSEGEPHKDGDIAEESVPEEAIDLGGAPAEPRR